MTLTKKEKQFVEKVTKGLVNGFKREGREINENQLKNFLEKKYEMLTYREENGLGEFDTEQLTQLFVNEIAKVIFNNNSNVLESDVIE